ncbi:MULTISPECIES: helix-turn-helix domain-containing protein [Clostridium]|uniref:DNA-binding protein n=2 Tax=Clostridium novyi TaxID=1542 RepID=A0AA88ZQM4_CLONO|nr:MULTISPECIES: helix-turn-helix transcriptional regulator [Clostridium]ABK60753.1 probable transcriptional regulator-related protein [Clostridium novyi NT]KEH87175.1 DNA-binding protein [Clostridium novyi A str. NCTC 538]KEH89872.1 DNA-binding protein [Clostridium novyi A str. 4540]KEH89998.1 DNA-binding protein [Clostridium novyi A str. BKT29909]KEH93801.1 DNA-binding protein [Clostridium novyi A str. GD211209]
MLNGRKIREFRLNLGYTAKDIESLTKNPKYETSISKSYLEELERGDKKNPSFRKVVVLASILRCKIDDLVVNSDI